MTDIVVDVPPGEELLLRDADGSDPVSLPGRDVALLLEAMLERDEPVTAGGCTGRPFLQVDVPDGTVVSIDGVVLDDPVTAVAAAVRYGVVQGLRHLPG